MYKYKRGITDKESLSKSYFFLTNNMDVMCSLTSNFSASRIYDGLYIKNKKVLVENLFEEIEIKNEIYKIANINTSNISVSSNDYVENVNLDENSIRYKINQIEYTKKLAFDLDSDALIINYKVQNDEKNNIKFRICPLITDRFLNNVKTSQMLHFTQRKSKNGLIINLSVHENRNLFISSDKLIYDKDVEYLNNVKHSDIDENLQNNVYTEDLFIPGTFEITVKKNECTEFNIYISTKKVEEKLDIENYFKYRESITEKVPSEYIELKDLTIGISQFLNQKICKFPYIFEFDDIYKKDETTLDRMLKYLENLEEYTRAIDGRFITLGKLKEAEEKLEYVKNIIEDLNKVDIENHKFIFSFSKLKLWYIEILNKFIGGNIHFITEARVSFVKKVINDLMQEKNQKIILKNIETAALMFNATRICKYMLNKLGIDDEYLYTIENSIKNLIETEFYVEEKRCMKENINDTLIRANIPMIYTLSLSYPCIVGQKAIILLDTIFKELYTPYGLRKVFKNSFDSKGMIYPKYLAHFIKANLRQNGVTSASKKIAYNLVKEILQDISKKVSGGVPYVYNEKGILIDNISYDLLTNAEMIRLYDMLT